jgi:hypothetical protein
MKRVGMLALAGAVVLAGGGCELAPSMTHIQARRAGRPPNRRVKARESPHSLYYCV